MGMRIPVMPTGVASETQMTEARTTTDRQALPAGDRPTGVGSTSKIRRKSPHANPKPISVDLGFRPESTIFFLTRSRNPPSLPCRLPREPSSAPETESNVLPMVDLLIVPPTRKRSRGTRPRRPPLPEQRMADTRKSCWFHDISNFERQTEEKIDHIK